MIRLLALLPLLVSSVAFADDPLRAVHTRATELAARGECAEALVAYDELARAGVEDPDVAYDRALCHAQLGELQREIAERRREERVAAARLADRLEEAVRLPRDQALRRLTAVPGVGQWTAAHVAQRAWGDPDEVPLGDFHLPALVGQVLAGRRVDDAGMLELLAPVRGHRWRAVRHLLAVVGPRRARRSPRIAADYRRF